MVEKRCPTCDTVKPSSEFYADKTKDGLFTYCKECCKDKAKGRYASDPEKYKANMKKWRDENPERSAYLKAKSAYGVTEEQYDELMKLPCQICGGSDNLCIDHDHLTGEVRGRLCRSCNTGLGFFYDDPELLKTAIDYLGGFEETYEAVEEERTEYDYDWAVSLQGEAVADMN